MIQQRIQKKSFIFLILTIFFSICLLPKQISSKNLSCFHIFRNEYSVFLYTIIFEFKNFHYTKLNYNGQNLTGIIHFKMCNRVTLENKCGNEASVRGQYIFENTSKEPGSPKCIILEDNTYDDWDYSMFEEEDLGNYKLGGVKAESKKVEMIPVGGFYEESGNLQNNVNKVINKGLHQFDPNHIFHNSNTSLQKSKLQVDKIIKLQNEEQHKIITIRHTFYCDKEETKKQASYDFKKNEFIIVHHSTQGCVTTFHFLRGLYQISYLTGIIFFLLGGMILFGGLKLHKNFLIGFVPILIAMVGFFCYFVLIDRSESTVQNLLELFLVLLIMAATLLIFIFVHHYIFLVTIFLVSMQLGIIFKGILEEHISFFEHKDSIWVITIFIYILFAILYFTVEDWLVIVSTSILGSMLLVVSFRYLHLTEYDLLLDLQLDKFENFENIDPLTLKMSIIFLVLIAVGFIFQAFWKCLYMSEEKDEEEEDDSEIQDHEIQLEHVNHAQTNQAQFNPDFKADQNKIENA